MTNKPTKYRLEYYHWSSLMDYVRKEKPHLYKDFARLQDGWANDSYQIVSCADYAIENQELRDFLVKEFVNPEISKDQIRVWVCW